VAIKRTAADAHFSSCIRHAAEWCCQHCGAVGSTPDGEAGCKLEASHLLGRRSAVTRWDVLNCVSLCHTCHREFTENPSDFYKWVESMWPGRWDILNEKRRHIIKNNKATRDEVSQHYRDEYNRMRKTGKTDLVSWI